MLGLETYDSGGSGGQVERDRFVSTVGLSLQPGNKSPGMQFLRNFDWVVARESTLRCHTRDMLSTI